MKPVKFRMTHGIRRSRDFVNFDCTSSQTMTLYFDTTRLFTLGVFKLRLRNYLRDVVGLDDWRVG